jgi:putative glycerol-1-phosphate prenyltransferase
MQDAIYAKLKALSDKKLKQLAVLVDPDKTNKEDLIALIHLINLNKIDFVLVGGSLMTGTFLAETIHILKNNSDIPVLLFPGNSLQISSAADGILLLSLISGRNPELLIGNHVVAAPMLKNSGLEIVSTGYMLIESGRLTSVVYMSNTTPIPSDKVDIALCTAMAGEMLGMKLIYMDAGSGASKPVPARVISHVKDNIRIPLIVGGGIRCASSARNAWDAGADIIVVGNALEKSPYFLDDLARERDQINKVQA